MKQDEIIEMADQSNLLCVIDSFHYDTKNWVEEATAFAKLVAAKERDAIVLLLRNLADDHTPTDCADMICALQSLGAIRARGEQQ